MTRPRVSTSTALLTTAGCSAVVTILLFVHPFAELITKEGEVIADLRLTRAEASLAVVQHFSGTAADRSQ